LEECCEPISPIYSLTISDNPACHFRPGAWRLGFNSGFVTLKIFSSRKNFSALPWPWTVRWSACRFLTGRKMRRKARGFPGWGAFRTGGGTWGRLAAERRYQRKDAKGAKQKRLGPSGPWRGERGRIISFLMKRYLDNMEIVCYYNSIIISQY